MYRYLIAVVVVFSLSTAALCDEYNWHWEFSNQLTAGTWQGASDDIDSSDRTKGADLSVSHRAIYKESGVDGWTAATRFMRTDYRSPLPMTPGASKTWHIYVWADQDLGGRSVLSLSWSGGGISEEALKAIEFKLTYVHPAVGVVDDPNTVGSYRILNGNPDGDEWFFPTAIVSNPLDGTLLDFTATVLPEPSSFVAMLGGAVGLAGFVIRRRQ